ncbi:carboxypeptidase B-like [Battus philenor]|uniref:carboxypeptidase B-like n=1 Tax=Battus philenor TaxID=42288 RepID=UPI0035CFCACB
MEYYIVEENQKVKKYKRKYNELVLLDITYDDDLEVCSLLDENKPFHNLIQRNEYLDLYHDKPLIEDESPPDNLYSVKISEPAINADQSPSEEEMNWSDYHNLEVIENWLDSLENTYPSLCTVVPIGTTLEGRLIKVLRVSNSEVGNAAVWVDAGIHAREWIAPAVNTFIADYVVRNFDSLPESFTNKDWYFLPVANPDGYDYSHKVERLWRKNRAWYGGECIGVDLNRNFSFAWGGRNSSTDPSSPFFRGRQPFSEPESSAMRDILVNSGIKFKVYITLHSYGQVIVFPYGYRDELCPDYVRLLEGATAMSKAIFASTGNIYKVGISKDVMYGASGTSTDWSYGSAHIPFCYLIELRSKQYKFNLPKEEIQETCNEILNCVKALMKFVDNHPSRSDTSL